LGNEDTQPKKNYIKLFAAGLLCAGLAAYTSSSHGSDIMPQKYPQHLQFLANMNTQTSFQTA